MSGSSVADRRWLHSAIELSRLAPPAHTRYAVGAVVVDHSGAVLATGYTGETDPYDHAEEVALAKLAGRWDPTRATLYSSLEPCTARKSRPLSCTGAILAAGIGRVVFAMREPLLFADCHGEEMLRQGGLDVVEVGDLAYLVGEVNTHLVQVGRC
jgi:diaminohydroxyphosphoribosylaminopyrimidine deaminase/5-amino-6-(5-phosphoribosylamino)uracil reductase